MTSMMQWYQPNIKVSKDERGNRISTPTIKNHSVTHHDNYMYCFGGYDGRRNHMTLMIYSVKESKWCQAKAAGNPPPGRNGHTATLAGENVIIIGGWLGSGPLAASDTHVLDISGGPNGLRWFAPTVRGTPPGPCNMHSADYVEHKKEVYVFRGGNGREYLNDLHAFDVLKFEWRKVETTGEAPQQRANHSSTILHETGQLFIFGGWNGKERLNDVHILDTKTSVWSAPQVGGILPHPRAGMTLTALRDRLYLFGGSGTSSKCFHDLQILDTKEMVWLDVSVQDDPDFSPHHYNQKDVEDDSDNYFSPNSVYKHSPWQTHNHDNLLCNSTANKANPNDTDNVQAIKVHGHGPGRRAGHTATAVNRHIYVFGGSCGSDYLNDFFVLDTDPPCQARITCPTTLQLLDKRLKHLFNDEEFSDVTFIVQGKKVFGHKIVLSLISDYFRSLFTTGFRESNSSEIHIPHCSHRAFITMMEYVYTGHNPRILLNSEDNGVSETVELLQLADQFFLDHLKQLCERILAPMVNIDTYEVLMEIGKKNNAAQLADICTHFERNIPEEGPDLGLHWRR